MFPKVVPAAAAAAGLGLTLAMFASPAGAATPQPVHVAPVTTAGRGSHPASADHSGRTTLGAGFISKAGEDHEEYSSFTIPTTCTKDGEAFLGTVGFTTANAYNTQALVAFGCSHGIVSAQLQSYDVANNGFVTAAASPGDVVQTYIYEDNSETYVDTYDVTTGADANLLDAAQPEIDNQFLTGNLEVPFYSLAGFGTVQFAYTVLDDAYLTKHTASSVTEMLNGVTQAKPGKLSGSQGAFGVSWKHQ